MLSKNNKILIGCLALLLVMSVGYALFSDTITINGTATAKGDFELTTTCDMGDEKTFDGYNSGSVSDVNISCEGNIVNASATLDAPGSSKWFRVMVTNTGTIPAKLKQVTELNNSNFYYCNKDECTGQIENIKNNEDKTNSIWSRMFPDENYYEDYEGEAWGVNFTFWDKAQLDAVLDPGETAYFYIETWWDSSSTTPGDPLTASLNAELTWEQVTE